MLPRQEGLQARQLAVARLAAQQMRKACLSLEVVAVASRSIRGQALGVFEEAVVQQVSLQGVLDRFRACRLWSVRGIEGHKLRMREPIARSSVHPGDSGRRRAGLPALVDLRETIDAVRLRREDARAAELWREQAAGREGVTRTTSALTRSRD